MATRSVATLPLLVVVVVVVVACAAALAHGREMFTPAGYDPVLDCQIKELAYNYSLKLLPQRAPLRSVFDALQLGTACGLPPPLEPNGRPAAPDPRLFKSAAAIAQAGTLIYVDAANGSDQNNGTIGSPLQSIPAAVAMARSVPPSQRSVTAVVLRQGTYYLSSPVVLTAADSDTTFANYPGEEAVVSGGRPLAGLDWKPYQNNVYVADVSQQTAGQAPFTSLFVNGNRAIRARFPDCDPATCGLYTNPTGYVPSAQAWTPPASAPAATVVAISEPVRNGTHFPFFQVGIGGPVYEFQPPISYWGTPDPVGGGGSTYAVPTGLTFAPGTFNNTDFKNPTTGIVHAFHCGHWGNWMFAVNSFDAASNTFGWQYGGFQEARGCGSGAEWYVENIFELLDSPNEWFLDTVNQLLYFYPNGSASFPAGFEFVAPALETLFDVEGSQAAPVSNVQFVGLTLTHTVTTYMAPYEVPSGGDASIHRGGAVFVQGAHNVLVDSCLFWAPGGNGLFLSNYVRSATVSNNEFVWVGDSAIAAVGSAELIDGTDGNQPRGTVVASNLVHEVGLFGKQTSPYFQSLACQTSLVGNVFFNGPRAGINFNDGFGGGNLVSNNLLFNFVRETADHGPINSWDRQPYITTVNDGTPSLQPKENQITRNFLINNYNSVWPIDHDDGSAFYHDTFNYLVYGGFKNYLGHSKTVTNNVYVNPDGRPPFFAVGRPETMSYPFCANSDGQAKGDSGWGDVWSNNTCVIGNPVIYEWGNCDPNDLQDLVPFTAFNTFYTPTASVQINCAGNQWTLAEYQQHGMDVGSTVATTPTYDQIIGFGKELLGL